MTDAGKDKLLEQLLKERSDQHNQTSERTPPKTASWRKRMRMTLRLRVRRWFPKIKSTLTLLVFLYLSWNLNQLKVIHKIKNQRSSRSRIRPFPDQSPTKNVGGQLAIEAAS
jgi:hypothetical protein